jgi:hypothetical protein
VPFVRSNRAQNPGPASLIVPRVATQVAIAVPDMAERKQQQRSTGPITHALRLDGDPAFLIRSSLI